MKHRGTSRANSDQVGTTKLPEVIEGSALPMIDPLLLKRPDRCIDYGLADEGLPVLHSVQ
ncbi:hypothetical protein T4D_5452 [Trichinella pseudospiralis]|uniref:Uncharacterized protein n=1 Tax=Trichinella pseudospiralis TaxID=6337 RepID=A0A0V1FN92_TRIPS|nr:hypothetical protein T4D_5452 [Trichinella pseudospiralis]